MVEGGSHTLCRLWRLGFVFSIHFRRRVNAEKERWLLRLTVSLQLGALTCLEKLSALPALLNDVGSSLLWRRSLHRAEAGIALVLPGWLLLGAQAVFEGNIAVELVR